MAECSFCKNDMLKADGCCPSVIRLKNGKIYRKILFGEASMDQPLTPASQSHDCGAKPNNFHHPGCDWERCPICGGQAIGCGCLEGAEDETRPWRDAIKRRPQCSKKKS